MKLSLRAQIAEALMKEQDHIISSLRQDEQNFHIEIARAKQELYQATSVRIPDEQNVLEAQQRCIVAEREVEETKRRNVELQTRCVELCKNLEAERKER